MNTKDAGTRIKQLLEFYNITASSFAERISVQRSSISHILSGRNNPSLDFMYKVIESFPEINPMWLIAGKGSMRQLDLFDRKEVARNQPMAQVANGEQFESYEDEYYEAIPEPPVAKEPRPKRKPRKPDHYDLQTSLPFDGGEDEEKQVEKIVIFYTDKTFASYKPES